MNWTDLQGPHEDLKNNCVARFKCGGVKDCVYRSGDIELLCNYRDDKLECTSNVAIMNRVTLISKELLK